MLEALNRFIAPLRQRVMLMIGRALVLAAQERQGIRTLQLGLLDGELADGAEHIQEYGFASRPLPGGEAVALFPGGDRSFALVVATGDRRYEPLGLEPGEVAIYSSGDRLVEGEELPEAPEGAPEGWPVMPADPSGPGPPLCRIKLTPGRAVEITGAAVSFIGTESLTLCAPRMFVGPPGGLVELGGEEGRRLARIGDCVEVATGSSQGKWPIVGGCE